MHYREGEETPKDTEKEESNLNNQNYSHIISSHTVKYEQKNTKNYKRK